MIYWTSTLLVCAMLSASALSYMFHQNSIVGFRELGFPDFFRIQLIVLKLMAIPILILPQVPDQVKEWAYARVALYLVTAIVAHHAHGDPLSFNLLNVAFLGLLVASNICLLR